MPELQPSLPGRFSSTPPTGLLVMNESSPSEDARDIDGAPAEAADDHVVALITPSLESREGCPELWQSTN